MNVLSFGDEAATWRGKPVRHARFEQRSLLPPGAACVVAGGVRETLSSLLGTSIVARVLEPVIPSPQGWLAIGCDALTYRLRGSLADVAIVLRAADASAIAAAAFGESNAGQAVPRALSPLERDAIDRAAAAIAATLAPVAGTAEAQALDRTTTITGFSTYFEVLLEPIEARIGIALSNEPAGEPHGALALEDLAGVTVMPAVRMSLPTMPASALASLTQGTILPLSRADAFAATLMLHGRPLAHGTCGLRDGRYALAIGT